MVGINPDVLITLVPIILGPGLYWKLPCTTCPLCSLDRYPIL